MKTTIPLTDENIELGIAGSAMLCPVALALADAGYPHSPVHLQRVYLHCHDHQRHTLKCSEEVQDLISEFDNNGTMYSCRLHIDTDEGTISIES